MEREENSHKQVIVIDKSLNMRKGKMVAQGAHASMGAILGLARRERAVPTVVAIFCAAILATVCVFAGVLKTGGHLQQESWLTVVAMMASIAVASIAFVLWSLARLARSLVIPLDARVEPWLTGRFKKICVSVSSEQELLDLYERAREANVVCSLIRDAGLTEFGGVPTHTAVAIGPDREDVVDRFTKHLPLL